MSNSTSRSEGGPGHQARRAEWSAQHTPRKGSLLGHAYQPALLTTPPPNTGEAVRGRSRRPSPNMTAWAMIAIAMCAVQPGGSWIIPVVTRATRSTSLQAQPAAGTGTGPSLQYNPEKYSDEKNAKNYRKLSEALEVCVLPYMCPSSRAVPPKLSLCATRWPLGSRNAVWPRDLDESRLGHALRPPPSSLRKTSSSCVVGGVRIIFANMCGMFFRQHERDHDIMISDVSMKPTLAGTYL